jgi:hypothetical protein
MTDPEWVRGDMLGLSIPAHSEALRIAAESFLTDAFRASGTLAADNRVVAVTRFEDWPGGSTGRKLILSVAYERPAPGLHTELFVKFSRDFCDPVRDRARYQMQSEVRFASLSRVAGFPIAVPACLFADYHRDTGTGILITQRLEFGSGGIERHYEKCLDYQMPAPLEHYEALTRALARLAGAHRAGRLPESLAQQFPFESQRFSVSDRPPRTAHQLHNAVAKFADFAAKYPRLLPKNIAAPRFIARFAEGVLHFPQHEADIKQFLNSQPELIALCHWNANVDNAWFWRNTRGELECGLLDWGHAGQMNVAMALWGALSGAEIELWDDHFERLLVLFLNELRSCGGPALQVEAVKLHLHLYVAVMGLAWLLDAPAFLQARIPDLSEVDSRFDPRIETNETARAKLHMMTTFLNLWDTQDLGSCIARMQTHRARSLHSSRS